MVVIDNGLVEDVMGAVFSDSKGMAQRGDT